MKHNVTIVLAVVAIIISLYAVVKPAASEVTKADFEAQKVQVAEHQKALEQIVDFINKAIAAQPAPKK